MLDKGNIIFNNFGKIKLQITIRRQAKAHVQFCTQDAEEKFLVSLFNRYNFKVGARPIRGREYIEDELIEL